MSILIPAFNEASRICDTLRNWINFLDNNYAGIYEIIVIMDGCTDETVDIVSEFAANNQWIIPLVYEKRFGKGGALLKAVKRSEGEILFFADADGSLPPREVTKFMKAIETHDLAIGCRYYSNSGYLVSLPLKRLVLSRIFNATLKFLLPKLKYIVDTQCGAKAVRKDAICGLKSSDLFITDFAFDVNLIYSMLSQGFSVKEIYVKHDYVEHDSKVSGNLFPTSFKMFLSLLKLRLYYSRFRKILCK